MDKFISTACALQGWRGKDSEQALFHTNIFPANIFKMSDQISENHSAPAISSHEPLTATMPVLDIRLKQQSSFPIMHQVLRPVQH